VAPHGGLMESRKRRSRYVLAGLGVQFKTFGGTESWGMYVS